jgi:phosphoribosyl isomerase A
MLAGPATERLREVLAATSRPVIASGGVAALQDLRALAALEPHGLEGVIVGKALFAGRFTVAEALAALAEAAVGRRGLGNPKGVPRRIGGRRP